MAACAEAGSPGDLKFVRKLGSGAFGTVYLVKRGSDLFALKEVDLRRATDKEKKAAEKEREALKLLAHEHVLGYVDSVMVKDYLCILTDYCQGGDMAVFLQNLDGAVPENLLLCWLYQMACALEYMHGCHPVILHRDLKPSNIYLTDKGDLKLGDLGIARILPHPNCLASTFCGTPCYMSPEVIQERPYDTKTDIWSLGCVLIEMATEEKAFNGTSLITLFRVIVNQEIKPLPPDVYSPELSEVMKKMLKQDPTERPTASEILDSQLLQTTLKKRKTPQYWLSQYEFLHFLGKQSSRQGSETCDSRPISLSSLSGTIPDKSFRNFYDNRNRSPTGRIHYDATVVDKKHGTQKHCKKNLDSVYSDSGSSFSSSCSSTSSWPSLMTTVVQNMTSTLMPNQAPSTAADADLATQMGILNILANKSVGNDSFASALQTVRSGRDTYETVKTLQRLFGRSYETLTPVLLLVLLNDLFRPSS